MKKRTLSIICIVFVIFVGFIPVAGVNAFAAESSARAVSSGETSDPLGQSGDIYDKIGNIDGIKDQFGGLYESADGIIGQIGNDEDEEDDENADNNAAQNADTTYKSSSGSVTKFSYNSGGGSKNYGSVTEAPTNVNITDGTNPFAEPSGVIDSSSDAKSIKWLQWYLNNLGYDMSAEGINGVYNKATENAVKQFQSSNGLNVTGKADEATKRKLREAYDKKLVDETKTTTNSSSASSNKVAQVIAPVKDGMDTTKKATLIVLAVILALSAGVIVVIILKGTMAEPKHEVEYLDDSEFFGDSKKENKDKSDKNEDD